MAVSKSPCKIVIVGCGPGSPHYLTDLARRAVSRADVLLGSRRLLDLFPEWTGPRIVGDADIEAALDAIAEQTRQGQSVVVLVSGDPGLFSLAQPVLRYFGPQRCMVIPGISSVQVAFARLGVDWSDAQVFSAHGRPPPLAADELTLLDKVAILAGSPDAIAWCAGAASVLRTSHACFLCENLTLDDERVRQLSPEQLAHADAVSLSIVLLLREK